MDKQYKAIGILGKLGRIPVILAVVGAFLNSGDLLAEFQPDGRSWVGYVAAASIGIGLYLCVEALLHKPNLMVIAGVAFFGIAEISGQILHAALLRDDVTVMTDLMLWIMGYVSPALVVVSGIVMAFVVRYGFPVAHELISEKPISQGDFIRLETALTGLVAQVQTVQQGVTPEPVPLVKLLETVQKGQGKPEDYEVDFASRKLRRVTSSNGNGVKPDIYRPAPQEGS